ncbi:MAG TPA: hypothetical protein VE907_19715 [Gammaproteobacteria bacterium]|nr:hypothetical protein [Gammaproteobacteria bacterium]
MSSEPRALPRANVCTAPADESSAAGRRRYRGARELAAVVALASRAELEQLVIELAGDMLTDHVIAAYVRLAVQDVRRTLAARRARGDRG